MAKQKTPKKKKSLYQKLSDRETKEDRRACLDPKKVAAVTREIADVVSRYVDSCGFQFPSSESGMNLPEVKKEPMDDKLFGTRANFMATWKMRWYATLNPMFPILLKRIGSCSDILSDALAEKRETDDRVRFADYSLDNNWSDLVFATETLGFYLGAFVGAKLTDATDEEMTRLANRLCKAIVR
jgi:hypothetical protein